MGRACEICGKSPIVGHTVSHAHNLAKRRWNPNLKVVRAEINGSHRRIRVCVSCIKAGKVKKVA